MRLAGAVMIFTGCLGMGLLYRERLQGRIRALQKLEYVLELLNSEIRYGRSTLPECCLRVGEQLDDSFGRALISVWQESQEKDGISFPQLFTENMERVMREMPLTDTDRTTFLQFIPPQGFADGQMQQRAAQVCGQRLEKTKEGLERDSREKSRIVVGLGAMGGLLLILILW